MLNKFDKLVNDILNEDVNASAATLNEAADEKKAAGNAIGTITDSKGRVVEIKKKTKYTAIVKNDRTFRDDPEFDIIEHCSVSALGKDTTLFGPGGHGAFALDDSPRAKSGDCVPRENILKIMTDEEFKQLILSL